MKTSVLALTVVATLALAGAPAGASASDPYLAKQWNLDRIGALDAWKTTSGTGAVVAIVDSGVDLTHPDLAANLLAAPDADFVEPTGNCNADGACTQDGPQDENGHGTHVAGIIAAVSGNGIGVASIAPKAKVLPVRVADAAGEVTGDLAAGVRYAASKGADVINLSLGFPSGAGEASGLLGELDELRAALDYAWSSGAVVIVAAGNDTAPLCAEPASGHNVICVGATDQRDLLSTYSNFDAATVDNYLVAPGGDDLGTLSLGSSSPTASFCSGDIFSTYLRTETSWCSGEAGYEALSGTSMAAPHVSGVAALLASKGLTNQQISQCLFNTAEDIGAPGRDPVFGFGLVDALGAVTGC